MTRFDFETNQASREWLEVQLRESGQLTDGGIAAVAQDIANVGLGASAKMYQLQIEYTPKSAGCLPKACLMKVSKPINTPEFDERAKRYAAWSCLPQSARHQNLAREVAFYRDPKVTDAKLPLLCCFGSEVDEHTYSACLLLEDLSATHSQPTWPLAPTVSQCEQTVHALADVHACWWGDVPSGPGGNADTNELVNEVVETFSSSYQNFCEMLGDRLSLQRRTTYERVLQKLPALLLSRLQEEPSLTCVHGDFHHWNVLLPNNEGQTVVLDWQTWRQDVPAYDLAYLIGLWWHREHRQREERRLLELYRRRLSGHGIEFGADQFEMDYRLSILRHLFTPVILSSFVVPAVWWPHVDRIFCTFEDWRCEELLD